MVADAELDSGTQTTTGTPDGVPSTRRHVLYLAIAAVVLVAALLLVDQVATAIQTTWSRQPETWVNLEEPAEDEKGSAIQREMTSFRFAVAPVLIPEESLDTYQPLACYLAARLGKAPLLQKRTAGEINELLRNRHCEAAIVSAYPLVRGEREFGLKPLAVPQINSAVTYHSLTVVPSSSAAATLLDLRGKRFASADLLSTTGWLYPAVWLKARNADANRFFLEHLITGSDERSLQAVACGYVDSAAIASVSFERATATDPALAGKLRVILKSPPLGLPAVAVAEHMPPALRQSLLAALLAAHEDPAGKEALAKLGIDRFVVPEETLYDGVRKAVETWEPRRP